MEETSPCTLRELVVYFLKLGTTGFGGPIALAGYMQRDLVEERRWISKRDYLDGLALAQLAPGPLAAQLAMCLGWTRGGVVGATLVGLAFILPSFLMVLALAAIYIEKQDQPWIQGLFYGVGAAVIAIVARSAAKLVKLSVGKDVLLWLIFLVNAGVVAATETEIVWVFAASGALALLVKAPSWWRRAPACALAPAWLFTGTKGVATPETLANVLWFFTQAGSFVFGSGLAIVPFLHGGVVERYHWLDERQFVDAVAVAMITPGPVVITAAFIGYLTAGPAGAALAAIGTFLPCYLLVLVGMPLLRRFGAHGAIKAFVNGVTAAATGAIAGAAFVLGKHAIYDVTTAVIFAATLVVLFKVKKVPEPVTILAAGGVGLIARLVLGAHGS